jgi:cytidine deaminase
MTADPTPDHELIQAARDLIDARYVEGRHQIGAALRTRSGALHVGVHVEANCGRITLCGEAVAIGAAATAGDTDIVQIVAVTESGDIVPPCGMCRELISDYAPAALVVLDDGRGPHAVPVLDLLPSKFDGAKYPNRRKDHEDGRCGSGR